MSSTFFVLQCLISSRINQEVEIPSLKEVRKVKGLESWKAKMDEVPIGERAAILLQNLPSDQISRTMSEFYFLFS